MDVLGGFETILDVPGHLLIGWYTHCYSTKLIDGDNYDLEYWAMQDKSHRTDLGSGKVLTD